MLVGYARISTLEQNLDLQLDVLKKEGCEKLFCEKIYEIKTERKVLQECLEYLSTGDCLVVWKLDRLGQSLKELIELTNILAEKNIHFKSIQEGFDTSMAGGKLIFHIFDALAEFQRGVIQERTRAGLQAARTRGRTGGRPKILTPDMLNKIKSISNNKDLSVVNICQILNIKRPTYYKGVKIIKNA